MTARVRSGVARHLNELLARADHPGVHWDHWRRTFAHRLLVGLLLAGDTMLTASPRLLPLYAPLWPRPNRSPRLLLPLGGRE